jgi:uncharacterized protein DUF2865
MTAKFTRTFRPMRGRRLRSSVGTGTHKALGGAITLVAVIVAPTALAQDFFSALFGGLGIHRRQPAMTSMHYSGEENAAAPSEGRVSHPRLHSYGGSQAFCVRSCDGRYFPLVSSDNQSRAALCNGFCPASETKVVYGSDIDSAVTEEGKPYSELPNAFRYREELVSGCTCNGKDTVGLAEVKIEDDPTLRKGDIVAGPNGLMVAGRRVDRHGASLNFSPAPESIRSRYQRVPVVARQ